MASSVSSMEIITLNCWGLKYLSAYRRERLSEIGHQLAIRSPAPEIVGLQECWTQEDYLSIREQTRNILPHGKFYYGGIFGAGLAILSKWPIVESSMVAYPLNGRPTAFFRGDWFVGKGVACAKIRYGNRLKDVVEVFCTHLHAPYEREPHDSYLCHRTAQAWEISKLMRNAIERGHLTIALGDFNMKPLSLAHRIITTHAPVLDAWLVRHPERISQETLQWSDVHSAFYNIVSAGTTCDSALNTWRWPKRQQRALMKNRGEKWPPEMVREDEDGGLMKDPYAKRLDYIFIGAPSSLSIPSSGVPRGQQLVEEGAMSMTQEGAENNYTSSSSNEEGTNDARRRPETESTPTPKKGPTEWRLKDIKIGFLERHPTLLCSLSDHFSVEASLSLSSNAELPSVTTTPLTTSIDATNHTNPSQVETPSNVPPEPQTRDNNNFLPPHIYDEIMHLTHQYILRERHQRRLRLSHFIIQVIISISSWVGIWFSSSSKSLTSTQRGGIGFVLVLLSSLGLVAGTIDGLIGGLFVSGELRALKEFEWEVRNVKDLALEYGRGGD